jgi:hypothetical protein
MAARQWEKQWPNSTDKVTFTTDNNDTLVHCVSDPNTTPTARQMTVEYQTTLGVPQQTRVFTVKQKALPIPFVMVGDGQIMYTNDGGQTWV